MAIKIIGFDADDTLWVNEPHYQNTEKYFLELLKGYATSEEISSALFKTEIENLELWSPLHRWAKNYLGALRC
jgi:putative hydrolase of the HAD superfamily